MSIRGVKLFFSFLCCFSASQAQVNLYTDSLPLNPVFNANKRIYKSGDTTWTYSGICKVLRTTMHIAKPSNTPSLNTGTTRFVQIHGNVQYDFLYRTLVDTPFYQNDFQQHSIRTNFNIVFKNVLPFRVTVSHRNSNSPYFKDITDVAVQFNRDDYYRNLKTSLLQQVILQMTMNTKRELQAVALQYEAKFTEVAALQQWISSPARIEDIIFNKEMLLRQFPNGVPDSLKDKIPDLQGIPEIPAVPDPELLKKALADKIRHKASAAGDSILELANRNAQFQKKKISDSLMNMRSLAYLEKKKKQLEEARKELKELEKKLKGMKGSLTDSLVKIKSELLRLRNGNAIRSFIDARKLSTKELPKGWKALTAVRSIGLGRTWADFSDLSVKNISLTGLNVEVNPGNFYFAAAVGKMNYRFRDFVISDASQSRQQLLLLRAGIGKKDGSNFILTWYDGKRNLLNPFSLPSSTTALQRVIGLSAETRFQIDNNHSIIAEFAKSSFNNTGNVNAAGEELFRKVKNFNDHSNEAYSLKVNSNWPQAGTKLNGYYRKMGENFQSFNLQPVNSQQESFHIKVQQQLLKKKLVVDAGLRKNDFSNPYIIPGISNSTVFKSFQLGLRIPKWPFVTVGYAPSSQLTVLDNRRIAENQYNTLNAVVTHSYKARSIAMMTNAMFLKFYNSSPDTGFIYYNASSFSLTQFFYVGAFQLQSGATLTDQQQVKVLTIDQAVTWQARKAISLTAGLKYNRINNNNTEWGATAGINMTINRIGTIQMSYDKSYLPGMNRNLVPVQMGRISLYRSF